MKSSFAERLAASLGRRVARWVPEAQRIRRVEQLLHAPRGSERTAQLKAATGSDPAVDRLLRRAQLRGEIDLDHGGFLPARMGTDELLVSLTQLRRGADASVLIQALARFDGRLLQTEGGPRAPAAALAFPSLVERFSLHQPDFLPGVDRGERVQSLLSAAVEASGVGAERALRRAALLGGDDVYSALIELRQSSGRRLDHAILAAFGVSGSRLAFAVLRDALQAQDVDPGRGFAQRRISADALGELGFAAGLPVLTAALRAEKFDFEGRPGAGLGIQYPVRANILHALGELGQVGAVQVLLPYLDDVSGSAFGGFYLPAMDALVKLGPEVEAPLRAWASRASPVGRRNADGVLAALAARREA